MNLQTQFRIPRLFTGLVLALGCSLTLAQTQPAPDAAKPAAQALPGIQSQNIADVKPDASSDPAYANQSNAERGKVQPGNNAPMWRQVGGGVTGYSSLPLSQAPEAGNLIQPFVQYPGSRLASAGEAWRQVRNHWIIPYGASLLLIALLAIGILHFGKGPMGHDHSAQPKTIERFTPFERAAHWANAGAFGVLAVSGLVMAFGKFLLLPLIGSTLFGYLTFVLKNVHNFVGPLFAVSLVVVLVTFVRDNIANAADFVWLSKAGGLLGDRQVPSHRFNAGEKGMYWWGMAVPGLIIVGSGLVLDQLVPGLGHLRSHMQIANMLHAVGAFWMVAMVAGHIYMGVLAVPGALDAMKTGYVSDSWAQEHHELWNDDIKAGKIPAHRTPVAGASAPSGDPAAQV